MADFSKIAIGGGLIAAGLASPIPIVDETIAAIIGIPMILSGLGEEDAAKKAEKNAAV